MKYQQILQSLEYTELSKTESYLYIRINEQTFLFYSNDQVLCFDINKFKHITVIEFYQLFFSFSNLDCIAVNSKNSNPFNFVDSNISKNLGEIFKIQSIDFSSNLFTKKKLEEMNSLIPSIKWKYSSVDNLFYLIPSVNTCVRFNHSTFSHLGDNATLREGTKIVSFLNPYTILEYYDFNVPIHEQINVGPITEGDLYIRSTIQELVESLKIAVVTLKGFVTILDNRIEILLKQTYDNSIVLLPVFCEQYAAHITNFNKHSNLDISPIAEIAIYPFKSTKKSEPITMFKFPLNPTYLQIFLDIYISNNLQHSNLKIINISYIPISITDNNKPAKYSKIPDTVFLNNPEFN